MISIDIKSHSLGKNKVLENISLDIPKKTVLGLVGTNGAGKSTLLRLMAGVYTPDEGSVLYDGENVLKPKTREDIFFLSDDPYYSHGSTGKSIIASYKALYPGLDTEKLNRLLESFKLDVNRLQRNFSKGMRRQLYVAIALSARPSYLLLDEAFDGLDAFTKQAVIEEINTMVEENETTVVISSHALSEIESFCDSYALIDGCTLCGKGSLAGHIARYCRFRLAFTEPCTEDSFSHLPVKDIIIEGKFVTITLEGDAEILQNALKELSPAVMEEIGVSFESIFIADVKEGRK